MMSLNLAILGHVDCGKTTLTRALAEVASTAAFDSHADRGGRRNTLDLGFSSFTLAGKRLALVDCPGHAPLIRAVLAASRVMDMAIVVIDVVAGIQAQTAEHLLLCSLICPNHILIVLTKIDLVDKEEVPVAVKRIRKSLKALGIREDVPIVPLSLAPGKEDVGELLVELEKALFEPFRMAGDQLLFAADHCFALRGKGTIVTGTVLQGTIRVGQEIELPTLKELRKVKGLQSWKHQVEMVSAGERAAILLHNFNPDNFSRMFLCAPSTLTEVRHVICTVNPISFYRSVVNTGNIMHISFGFETVTAKCGFLRVNGHNCNPQTTDFEQLSQISQPCVVLLSFERPIYTQMGFFYIASKLDHQGKGCRFAFHGQFMYAIDDLSAVRRFTIKHREGVIERLESDRSLICNSLFKKETNMSIFEGKDVVLSTGEIGRISTRFGKGGKARIELQRAVGNDAIAIIKSGDCLKVHMFIKKFNDHKLVSYVPEDLRVLEGL